MKSLHVASTLATSFRLFTRKQNGNHAEVAFGSGSLNGGRVTVKVEGETLEFANPVEAIARATKEGYVVVGV